MDVDERVRAAQAGDEIAFTDLYRYFKGYVGGIVRQYIKKNEAEVEDMVQHTLAHAFRKLKQFKFESAFRTWLTRVTISQCLMWHRRRGARVHETSLEFMTEELQQRSLSAHIVDSDQVHLEDLGLRAAIREDPNLRSLPVRADLEQAIEKLAPGYKMMFKLRAQGYEYSEIAEMTGRTVGNAKSQVAKAKQVLARTLGENYMVKGAGR